MNRILFTVNICLSLYLIVYMSRMNDKSQQDQLRTAGTFTNIQVNRLPAPFNIDGGMPFQVWVDGTPLPVNGRVSRDIVAKLNLEFEQPIQSPAIMSGDGWLRPKTLETK